LKMNKYLKLILIILAFIAIIFVIYVFAKNMTGRVVLNEDNNESINNVSSGNETDKPVDRNINNYNVTAKNPSDLNEGECTTLDDGRKLCLVKRGANVTAGTVNQEDGQTNEQPVDKPSVNEQPVNEQPVEQPTNAQPVDAQPSGEQSVGGAGGQSG